MGCRPPSHKSQVTSLMNKIILLSTFLFLSSVALQAQHLPHRNYTADSIAFVSAHWQTDSLDGFKYSRHHFMHRQVFNSNQYFCVIEIPRGSEARLAFVSDTNLTTLSDFVSRHKALAGINGSYFNMRTGAPVCFLRIDGKNLGENTPGRDTVHRKYYQNASIRLLRSGRPRFFIPDSSRKAEALYPDSNIMTAGPMLLYKGVEQPQRLDRRFVYSRHNRTAIGLKPDGTVVMLVADGRARHESEGLSIPELAKVMRWLGCSDAVNLDGGGSSTMFVKDKGHDGIVNHPSDNGRFDAKGQRPVANAIVVVK